MKKQLFEQLCESIREGGAIRRGEFKPARVSRLTSDSPQVVRARLGLSQSQFARVLGISVATLQNWEQGRRKPTGAEKVLINLDRYGNTSAATIPTVLDEAVRDGRIQKGQLLLLDAFGAGFTYGAMLIRW